MRNSQPAVLAGTAQCSRRAPVLSSGKWERPVISEVDRQWTVPEVLPNCRCPACRDLVGE